MVSRVRCAVFDGHSPDMAAIVEGSNELKALAHETPEINAFMDMPLKSKFDVQRRHARDTTLPACERKGGLWSPRAEMALQRLPLAPKGMAKCKVLRDLSGSKDTGDRKA